MKKILLCGATHGSNFGDLLFAQLFKDSITKDNNDVELYFTRTSTHSEKLLKIKSVKIKELFTMDGMVYISGGYFGQSHQETVKESILRFLNYFIYGLITSIRKKPIAIIGVGAGPLERNFLKKSAVYLFNKAKIVSVRDIESKNYMLDYGVNREIIVTSDSAQIVNKLSVDQTNILPKYEKEKLSGKHIVLVHLPGGANQKQFKKLIVNAIKESLFNKEDVGFILSYDQVNKSAFINEIYDIFPRERTVVYNYTTPNDFLKVISNVDTLITTKLHVGIIGVTFNKAVISFPHHPGKTKRYYEQIGYPEHAKSLFNVNKEEARQMIKDNYNKKLKLPESLRSLALKNFQLVNEFIKDIQNNAL